MALTANSTTIGTGCEDGRWEDGDVPFARYDFFHPFVIQKPNKSAFMFISKFLKRITETWATNFSNVSIDRAGCAVH